MKRSIYRFLSLGFVAMLLLANVNAQDRTLASAAGDKYVISAKAGGVNFTEGSVSVVREAGNSGLLVKGDMLEVGDRVSTGADGKAEILLTPGSYVRMAGDSEFHFRNTSLEDLELGVDKGSAIFEVFAEEDYPVTVVTPRNTFSLIRTGVFRVDVDAEGNGSLEVWKGRARIDGVEDTVKGGREVSADGVVSKFDRDDRDAFETWSRERSKQLAKIVSELKRDTWRTPLINSFWDNRWNFYGSYGLWVYDPFWGSYCFLPFGYGWSSPYGYGFGRSIWYYRLPRVIYYQPPPYLPTPPTTSGTSNPNEVPTPTRPRRDDTMKANAASGGAPVKGPSSRPPFSAIDRGGSIARPTREPISPVRTPVYTRRPVYVPQQRPSSGGAIKKP